MIARVGGAGLMVATDTPTINANDMVRLSQADGDRVQRMG